MPRAPRHGGDAAPGLGALAAPQHADQPCEQRAQLKTLQDTAGHANIATTAAYLHKADNERYDEIIGSVNGKGIM